MKRVLTSLVLVAALGSPSGALGEIPADPIGDAVPPDRTDRDANGISDTLQAKLDSAGTTQLVDVIATFSGEDAAQRGTATLPARAMRTRYRLIPAFSAALNKGQIAALARQSGLRRIEERTVYSVSNDSANADFGTAKARVDYAVDGTGVGICIIDTGIDPAHEQFDDIGKIAGWFDAISGLATPYDNHGHGTHVAGTAAGAGTGTANAATYRGVATGATLYVAKALTGSGYSVGDSVEVSIEWCVDQAGVDIISMSLGGGASDGLDPLSLIVNAAVDAGKIVVVAAGNGGDAPGSVSTPAAAEKAISVGAVAEWSGSPSADNYSIGVHLAPFSSRGPTLAPTSFIKPDIAAPGLTITSANAGTTNGYNVKSGTSMATPFTAGTIALMLEADPTLSYSAITSILSSTAVDRGPVGKDNDWGWGLLDGYAAVSEAAAAVAYTPTAFPTYTSVAGSVADNGVWQHTFVLGAGDLDAPIAATILLDGYVAYPWSPDLDTRLKDPNGVTISESICPAQLVAFGCGSYGRQETLAAMPTVAGTYTIEVYPWDGNPNNGMGGTFDVYLSTGPLAAVVGAGITLAKTPDFQSTSGPTTFTIVVKNTGAIDLRQVAVDDPLFPACDKTAEEVRTSANNKGNPVGFLLKIRESFAYTCSGDVAAGFTNTATATGTASGVPIQDSDTATVVKR
jgi:serine protease AprX